VSNLGNIANVSAILTAFIAIFGYCYYQSDRYKKCKLLEDYLKAEKQASKDQGQRSLLHLMAKVGMTEAELIQASFRSKHISRKIAKDPETGYANTLLLEWVE
jgi:hypothetical protein